MSVIQLINSFTKKLVSYELLNDNNGIIPDGFIYRKKGNSLYKLQEQDYYDVRDCGLDDETDCTMALQSLINAVSSAYNGGKIVVSCSLLIKGTITIPKNISLVSSNIANPRYIDSNVIIYHQPVNPNTDLFITDAPAPGYGYIAGINISGFTIKGSANSRYCFNFKNLANSIIERCYTDGFYEAVLNDTSMNVQFILCNFAENTNSCVRFVGGESTTTSFIDCYLHFSKWAVVIESMTAYGCTFDKCIVESCTDGGYDIWTDNHINVVSPYCENIPRAKGASKPFLQFGINGIDKNVGYPLGTLNIIGGIVSGCNFGIDESSVLMKIGSCQMVACYGTVFQRSHFLVQTTNKAKFVNFDSITMIEVADKDFLIYDKAKVFFNKVTLSNTSILNSESVSHYFKGVKNWIVRNNNNYTDSDLEFEVDDKKVLVLDRQGNQKFNYNGAVGSANNLMIFGKTNAPVFVGLGADNFALWAQQDTSGVTTPHYRDSLGNIYVNGVLSVSTANRPHYNFIGKTVYDTDLKKPIYFDGENWRDANSNIV